MVHAQLICVPAQVSKCLSGVCQDKQLGQDCECCCLAIIMGTRGFTIGAKSATKLWWQAHCTRAEWNIAESRLACSTSLHVTCQRQVYVAPAYQLIAAS